MQNFLKSQVIVTDQDTREQAQIKEKHRILNAYVHAYKDMLRLKNLDEQQLSSL